MKNKIEKSNIIMYINKIIILLKIIKNKKLKFNSFSTGNFQKIFSTKIFLK